MRLTEFFEKKGKKKASKSKALLLIEKVWPDIHHKKNIRPSMFVNEIFETIEKKFNPGNSVRGSIFEYLIMCVFLEKILNLFFARQIYLLCLMLCSILLFLILIKNQL